MNHRYEIQGITDDITECQCCGKTNLKRTVALRRVDDTETLFFGVDCASRALRRTSRRVRAEAEVAQQKADFYAERRARCAATLAWIDALLAAEHGHLRFGNTVHRLAAEGDDQARAVIANLRAIDRFYMTDGVDFATATRAYYQHLATA